MAFSVNRAEGHNRAVVPAGPDVFIDDDDDTDEDDPQRNPLMVDVVLRNVFSYLKLNELKNCRQVNSFWNMLTVPYLKKSCGLISFNSDNYWTNIANHDIDKMKQFVECCDASTNFPFSKLDIGTSVIREPPHEMILTNFFRSVSPWVTEITIRDEWGQNLFSGGLPEKFLFPSLEVLTIHFIQTVNREEDLTVNFEFITNIMEKATALDKLVLIDHNGLDGKVVTHFIKAIEQANCKKFSKLDIAAQIEDDHLIQMSTMGVHLNVLILDFWGSMIDQNSLKIFLESQSESLLDLKIADYAMSSNFSVEFPRMKKLKNLMIQGSMLGRICVTFPNISYVNQFPVLKRLSFSNALNEWDEFLKFGIQPVATVSELKLPGDFCDEDSLLHAARLFPNMKKLEVPAFLRNTNVVYEAMPNLEELILITKHVGEADDIITGLTLAECEEIKHFSETMFRTLEQEFDSILTTKPLSCLKRLKILRLKCKRNWDPVELTDVSCRLVLLKMNSLQCVDFWGRHPPVLRISTSVLDEMRKKFLVLC